MSESNEQSYDLPMEKELQLFYIPPQAFHSRFQRIRKITNTLNQEYIVCKDTVNLCRALYKHYLYQSSEQKQAVLTNLTNFIKLNELQGICKFIAYTCEADGNSLTAVFEYNDISLDEFMKNRLFEGNNCDFYGKMVIELAKGVDEALEIGLQIDDINKKNILIQYNQQQENLQKFKILYDQRQKDFDLLLRYGSMVKIYWSPEKLYQQVISKEDFADDEGEQAVYQIGLLLLDVVYECENTNICLNDSQASITDSQQFSLMQDQPIVNVSEKKKGYYSINVTQNTINVQNAFITFKLNFLLQSKNTFIKDLAMLIRSMIAPLKERITMKDLIGRCQKYGKTYHHQSPNSKMLASHESLFSGKLSSDMIKDSLKYSANSMNYNEDLRSLVHDNHEKNEQMIHSVKKQLHMPLSATTIPSQAVSHNTIQQNAHVKHEGQQKYMEASFKKNIRAQQLLKNCKSHHQSVVNKLNELILKISSVEAKGYSIQKKQYYDGSYYWGELNPVNNKRQGIGLYVYKSGEVYYGNWKQNTLIQGTYMFKNGESFEGVAKNGKQGYGIYHYANGNIYQGHWKDDLKNGIGTMIYPSGSKYEGQWDKGKKHGRGIYYYENGMIFQGNFALGRKYGDGTFIFQNGTKILGFWDNNHLEGQGKIYYNNGDYYEGNFHLSEKSGEGSYKWEHQDGEISYKGEFKKDNLDGYAKIRFRNGEQYEGKVKNGRRDGHGTYEYQNGDKFIGEWKNDEKILGKYMFRAGQVFEGKFKNGQITYGTMLYTNGQLYQGQFQNGQRHGFGRYANQMGAMMFEGNWEKDEFVGERIL